MGQELRLHLKPALKSTEIRRACCAIGAIIRAADILDAEPPAVLEEVRDYCIDYIRGRRDWYSEFKRAYIKLVCDHLELSRQLERRFYGGVSGEDWPHDDDKH